MMRDSFMIFAERNDEVRIMALLKRKSLYMMVYFRWIFAVRKRASAAVFLLQMFFDAGRDVPAWKGRQRFFDSSRHFCGVFFT